MTIKQLEYYLAFAACLNLTRAAEVCNTTQPNLARQIKQLEDEFDTKFYTRSGNTLTLTAAGILFADDGAILMQQYRQFTAKYASPLAEKSIVFGYPGMRAQFQSITDLQRLIGSELAGYPVEWVHGTGQRLLDAELLDICFCFDGEEAANERYRVLEGIDSFPVRAAVPHSLTNPGDMLMLKDFGNYSFLLLGEKNRMLTDACMAFFKEHSPESEVSVYNNRCFDVAEYYRALRDLNKVGFVPAVSDSYEDIWLVPAEKMEFSLQMGVAWNKRQDINFERIVHELMRYIHRMNRR